MHTPGPWIVAQSSNPKNGSSWRDIHSLGTPFTPSYVGEALENDAHLIAAAPEMLEALRKIESCLAPDDQDDAALSVRAAIAKAEGK